MGRKVWKKTKVPKKNMKRGEKCEFRHGVMPVMGGKGQLKERVGNETALGKRKCKTERNKSTKAQAKACKKNEMRDSSA